MGFAKEICNSTDCFAPALGEGKVICIRLLCQRNLQCGEVRIESELDGLFGKLACQLAVELDVIVFVNCDLQNGLRGGGRDGNAEFRI